MDFEEDVLSEEAATVENVLEYAESNGCEYRIHFANENDGEIGYLFEGNDSIEGVRIQVEDSQQMEENIGKIEHPFHGLEVQTVEEVESYDI